MCRTLGESFCTHHATLWAALPAALGVSDADLFFVSLAFIARPPPRVNSARESPLGARLSSAMRDQVRARVSSELGAVDAVSAFLRRLPRDLLFVMRVMGIARSISVALGNDAASRLRVYEDAAASAPHSREDVPHWRGKLSAIFAVLVLRARRKHGRARVASMV